MGIVMRKSTQQQRLKEYRGLTWGRLQAFDNSCSATCKEAHIPSNLRAILPYLPADIYTLSSDTHKMLSAAEHT